MTTRIQRHFFLTIVFSFFLILLFMQASLAEAADIRAVNAFPTANASFYTTDSITFLGTVENMESTPVGEAGYADVQIDWDSDGPWVDSNANPDGSGNMLGALSSGGTKNLQEIVSNPPVGNHRYRFAVDTTGEASPETDDANNLSPWVSFTVVPVPVAPTVTFSASPNPVTIGNSTTLTWTVTDATSCTASNGWSGVKDAGGSTESVSPVVTTLYTISCTGPGGSATKSFTVDVVSPAPTVTFTNSANPVNSGTPVTLTWSTVNANTCTASGGWSGAKSTGNNESVSPVTTTIYTLVCIGTGGTTTKSQTISVNGSLPGITLTATPNPVPTGGSVTLDWSVTDATSCTGASGSAGWPGSKTIPTGSQTLSPTVPVLYRLTCTNATGVSTKDVTITFTGLPDLIPLSWIVNGTNRAIHTSIGSTTLHSLVYNQPNTFHGKVQNNGTAATSASFPNRFLYNWGITGAQVLGGSVTGGPLAVGEISPTLVSDSFTPDKSGLLEMSFCVDTPSAIGEMVEGNNCGYRTYAIAGLTGTPSTTMTIQNGIGTTTANGSIYFVVGRSMLGSTTTINWHTDDATSCTGASSPVDATWNGARDPVSGSVGVSPTASTTYSLECTGPMGKTIKTVRLYVTVMLPQITFSGSTNSIVRGTSAVLSWDVTSAQSCTGTSNPYDLSWNGHKNRVSGTQTVSPTANTTYTLTCSSPIGTGAPGGTVSKSFTVGVTEPPPTVTLTASFNPITTVVTDKTTLTWTPHDATSCTGTSNPNDDNWNGAKDITGGTLDVSPEVTTTYTLSCNGQGVESATTQLTVSVVSTAPIINFTLNDNIIIESKENATFMWNIQGATSCTGTSNPADPDWDTFNFSANLPSGSKVVQPLVTTTYALECTGPWGENTGQPRTIDVIPEATVTDFRVCVAGGGECRTQGQTLDVNPGTPLEVFWDSEDATSCSAISGYQFGTAGDPTNGEDLLAMATPKSDSTDTYTIACGSLGYITSDSVSITVHTNSVLPAIWIMPKVVESSGGDITVNWDTNNGDQTVCTMKGGGLTWEGGPLNWNLAGRTGETGFNEVKVLGRTSFVITCPSKDGTDTESATTTVELSPRIWGR